jgi:RND family efflux transporter MFP subunit
MPANRASILLKLLIVLVVVGAGTAAAVYYSRPVVAVVAVSRRKASNVVPGSVVVDAARVSPITSEVEGKVSATQLEPGVTVKEGEVVARLDTGDIQLEIDRIKSELDGMRATAATNLELNKQAALTEEEKFDAIKRDYDRKNIADLAFKQAQRAFDVGKQQRAKTEADDKLRVEALDNALKVALRKKEKMEIRAPFDGTISEVFAWKNDFVAAKGFIATVIAQERRVRAKISEENFAAIKVGDKAEVSFLGYRGQKFNATVTQKLPTAEADTQRYTVYLKVEIPAAQLLANLTGDVGITVDERPNALLVPRLAMWDGYVRVIENGRAFERKLETGFVGLNQVEVLKGVKEGDLIVVQDPDKLENGQRVRVALAR